MRPRSRRGMRSPSLAELAALGVALAAVGLSLPPLRAGIERSMALHMLVQMPLLVAAGWLLAARLPSAGAWLDRWNAYGLAGLAAVLATGAFWMLPVALDRAVLDPGFDAVKVGSLLALGAVLRDSWARMPAVAQLFALGYTLPMMALLGAYFATGDRRLCNVYGLETQVATGKGLVVLAVALGIGWIALLGARRLDPRPDDSSESNSVGRSHAE